MQDIVYKLVPNLQQKELKLQEEFYKSRDMPIPTALANGQDGIDPETDTKPKPTDPDQDYHRSDEQLSICLENKGTQLRKLKRKFLRCSAHATITHLKKFVALKIFNNFTRYKDIDILCNDEILGKDHTLKFIAVTRWQQKDKPLLLQYRRHLDF